MVAKVQKRIKTALLFTTKSAVFIVQPPKRRIKVFGLTNL